MKVPGRRVRILARGPNAGWVKPVVDHAGPGTFRTLTGLVVVAGMAAVHLGVARRYRVRQRELVRSNADLDAFTSRVTHDLRNLFAPMKMLPGLLRRAKGDPRGIEELADRLQYNLKLGEDLMEDLLRLSREGRVSSSETTRVDVTMERLVAELQPLADQIGAEVQMNLSEARHLIVACPESLFHALMSNILGNAVKFLGRREVRRVGITARPAGRWCTIAIADTGPGIAPEALPHIWEPFYRAPDADAPGTGVGLASVRRLVDAINGHIEVESVDGRGTTFRLFLPIAAGSPLLPSALAS